jgi:hypothetical protein
MPITATIATMPTTLKINPDEPEDRNVTEGEAVGEEVGEEVGSAEDDVEGVGDAVGGKLLF